MLLIENTILNIGALAKKTDYDPKKPRIENEYFTASDYNKSTGEIINEKIKEKELVDRPGITVFMGNPDYIRR